jgi:hypothetical protein
MDGVQNLATFGFGVDTVVLPLGPRCWQVTHGEAVYVLKVGPAGPHSEGLRNEVGHLRACTDRVIDLSEGPSGVVLLLQFVPGEPLSTDRPVPVTAVRRKLTEVHRHGLVFCDLTPANILVDGDHISLIDWEFCCPVGTDLGALDRRPYSSSFTHPDLIWGRGSARINLDLFSLDRMLELGFLF